MYLEGQRHITPKYPQDTRNAVVRTLSSINDLYFCIVLD